MAADPSKIIRQALMAAKSLASQGNNAVSKTVTKADGGEVEGLITDPEERRKNLANFMEGAHPEMFDEQGKPKVFYHGSKMKDFVGPNLKTSIHGDLGPGLYLTDNKNLANKFAMGIRADNETPTLGGSVIPVHLSMKQPMTDEVIKNSPEWRQWIADHINSKQRYAIKFNEHQKEFNRRLFEKIKNNDITIGELTHPENFPIYEGLSGYEKGVERPFDSYAFRDAAAQVGYDGLIVDTGKDGKEYVSFDPEKHVKSAIGNRGTYDRREAEIHKEGGGEVEGHVKDFLKSANYEQKRLNSFLDHNDPELPKLHSVDDVMFAHPLVKKSAFNALQPHLINKETPKLHSIAKNHGLTITPNDRNGHYWYVEDPETLDGAAIRWMKDHQQQEGGGFNQYSGERSGDSDIDVHYDPDGILNVNSSVTHPKFGEFAKDLHAAYHGKDVMDVLRANSEIHKEGGGFLEPHAQHVPTSGVTGYEDGGSVDMGINVRNDDVPYADHIVDGKKKYETRDSHSLRPYVGKRVAIVRTGQGPAAAIGEVTVGEPHIVDENGFRALQDQHLVPPGSQFDIKPGGQKYLYPMINPERYSKERSVGHGIVSRKVNKATGSVTGYEDGGNVKDGDENSEFINYFQEDNPELTPNKKASAKVLSDMRGAGYKVLPWNHPNIYDRHGTQYHTLRKGPVSMGIGWNEGLQRYKDSAISKTDFNEYSNKDKPDTPPMLHLAGLIVDPDSRQQGYAHQAMQDLTSAADRSGMHLFLQATPFGGKKKELINKKKLVDFYKQHGFQPAEREREDNFPIMHRVPMQKFAAGGMVNRYFDPATEPDFDRPNDRIGKAGGGGFDPDTGTMSGLGTDPQQQLQSRLAGPQIIKEPGGQWLSGSVERVLEPLKKETVATYRGTMETPELAKEIAERGISNIGNHPENYRDARMMQLNDTLHRANRAKAVNDFISKQLTRYVKNDMGTEGDPVRALAERGILHYLPSEYGNADLTDDFEYAADAHRKMSGRASHPIAKLWENNSDNAINQLEKSEINKNDINENPWINKLDPWDIVNDLDRYGTYQKLGFDHLVDELHNSINPESGLPNHLQLRPESLSRMSVPQAVQHVHNINKWREENRAEANKKLAFNPATFLHKDYPGTDYAWYQIKHPYSRGDQNLNFYLLKNMEKKGHEKELEGDKHLEEALKYEGDTMGHCVGGYSDDVANGESKIYSLRNKKTGEPHVTVEASPKSFVYSDLIKHLGGNEELANDYLTKGHQLRDARKFSRWKSGDEHGDLTPLEHALRLAGVPEIDDIKQIKGKGNKKPVDRYLPYVQDFVKSGNWGRVGDIQNTDLVDLSRLDLSRHPEHPHIVQNHGRFHTKEETNNILSKNYGSGFNPYATGGAIIARATGGVVDSQKAIRRAMMIARGAHMADGGTPTNHQPSEQENPTRNLNNIGLYSAAAEAARALPQQKGTPQQMLASLKGVKPEEIRWSGVKDALSGQKTINKNDLADYFQQSLPQIEYGTSNKYSQYTIPGGKNYVEHVLSIPSDLNYSSPSSIGEPNAFTSSHWRGVENPLLHVRMSDRETPDPKPAPLRLPKSRKIKVASSDANEKTETNGWDTGIPGLVINRPLSKKSGNNFVLTHEPSGYAIKSFDQNGDHLKFHHAMELANRIGSVTNWDNLKTKEDVHNLFPKGSDERENIVKELSARASPIPVSKKAQESFNPERILHLEEVQSDWAQQGRKEGFKKELPDIPKSAPKPKFAVIKHPNYRFDISSYKHHKYILEEFYDDGSSMTFDLGYSKDPEEALKTAKTLQPESQLYDPDPTGEIAKWNEENRKNKYHRVAEAPYVTSTDKWTDLALKHALTQAAKGGYDRLIWTPGEQHADRYSLREYINKLAHVPDPNMPGHGTLYGFDKRKNLNFQKRLKDEELPDYIGKEVAQKLLSSPLIQGDHRLDYRDAPAVYFERILENQDLGVGGEGMIGYYNSILPKRLLALAREHDQNAQIAPHKTTDKKIKGFPSIKITPEMRESILKNGFKAYRKGGYVEKPTTHNTHSVDSATNKIADPRQVIHRAMMLAKGIENAI